VSGESYFVVEDYEVFGLSTWPQYELTQPHLLNLWPESSHSILSRLSTQPLIIWIMWQSH